MTVLGIALASGMLIAVCVLAHLVVRHERQEKIKGEARLNAALDTIQHINERLDLAEGRMGEFMRGIDDQAEYIERLTKDYHMYLKNSGRGGDWTVEELMKALNAKAKYILEEVRKQ